MEKTTKSLLKAHTMYYKHKIFHMLEFLWKKYQDLRIYLELSIPFFSISLCVCKVSSSTEQYSWSTRSHRLQKEDA